MFQEMPKSSVGRPTFSSDFGSMCHMHAVGSRLSIRDREQGQCTGKYPTSCHPDSPPAPPDRPMNAHIILFLRQDAYFMKTAVKLAGFNVRVGHWNKGTMTASLRTCAVSRRIIENVWCVGKEIESGRG